MALATVKLQDSCSIFPYVPPARSKGSQLKYSVSLVPIQTVGRKDRLVSLKGRSCLGGGVSFVLGTKSKLLKITAFKGGSQHDDSVDRSNGSKSLKIPVKVSYLQHESEESIMESPKVQNVAPSPITEEDATAARHLAIQNLLRNWLMLLRTPLGTQPMEEALQEPYQKKSEAEQKYKRLEVFKAACYYFLGLDPTIKIPLLMFTPLYLVVSLAYGSEVSKELTPLWILGPLTVALYVKMLRQICSLYVFSFKQTIKVVKNMPACYLLVQEFLFHGKLKEAMQKYLWQPLVDTKTMEYEEVADRKLKDLQGWLVEKYLDVFDAIWPHYCRTIRFLKRANLI